MSNLYWLTEEQMARLRPYFPRATAGRGLMIGGCSAASFSSIATGCAGVTHRRIIARTRRLKTGGSGGVRRASSSR